MLFDVIGVTELFSMSTGECTLSGYHPLEYKTRTDSNKSRGGIGIYIRDNLQYKLRNDLSIFIPHVFESLFVEIIRDSKNVVIGIIYRPNSYPEADIDIFAHNMFEIQNLLAQEKN